MDKVTILSRKKFFDYKPEVPKENVVAIRIDDTTPPANDYKTKLYCDTLSLAFFDNPTYAEDIDRTQGAGSTSLTEKDKEIIDAYIDKHADRHFVLHCEAGKSRSAAIGYYILKRLGYTEELNDKKKLASELGFYFPNVEVYGLLTGKIYTKETAIELLDEIKNPE